MADKSDLDLISENLVEGDVGNDDSLEGDDIDDGDGDSLEGDGDSPEGDDDSLEGDDDSPEGDDDSLEGDDDSLEGDDDSLEGDDDSLESDDVDDDDSLEGDAAARLIRSNDMTLAEAQNAIRELLIYVRDGRLKAGAPEVKVTAPTTQGAQIVRVDTPESAATLLEVPSKSEFEEAVDEFSDSIEGDDLEDVRYDCDDDDEEDFDEVEAIPLKFSRKDHDHNVHAWKKGDDINVSMRVLKSNGEARVLTAKTSHEAEVAKLVECFRQLGYTPAKILRLPLKELASRLGASAIIKPMAKNAADILGYCQDAPYVVGLK